MLFPAFCVQISLANEERRNGEAQYNPSAISELGVKYPHINWIKYFKAIMPDDLQLPESEIITVSSPDYFKRLAGVLAVTSKRTIANFFVWRSALGASNFLTDQIRMRKIGFLLAMSSGGKGESGQGQGGTTQWKECTTYTAAT